jgi:hypothetical protein
MTHAGSTIQYRINGGALLPYNPAVPPRLDASGTYEVSAVADDGATGSATFKLDLEAPTITPAKANLAFALNGFVGTPFSCADATSGIKTCAVTKPIAVNKEGTFTFTVQATDVAGNTASLVVPYIVDATAPKIALTIPDEGDTYKIGKNIIVRYTCNDPINKNVASGLVQCDGPLASGSKLDTSKLGTFSFTVTARDAVGHVSTNTHRYQITK